MERHEWRERTEDGLRYFRAEHHAGRWAFFTTLKHEPDWHLIDPPDEAFLRALRELLWRKYQRKRCPWRMIEDLDQRLEDLAQPDEP